MAKRTHTPTAKFDSADFFERHFWTVQVGLDNGLRRGACNLVILLSQRYLYGKDGKAWPSETTLASDLDCSVRTIRELIGALVERGHLSVGENRGRVAPMSSG